MWVWRSRHRKMKWSSQDSREKTDTVIPVVKVFCKQWTLYIILFSHIIFIWYLFLLLLFSHSVVSDSLRPMDCSIPGFPVLHYILEFAQTHVHWVGDAVQPFILIKWLFMKKNFPVLSCGFCILLLKNWNKVCIIIWICQNIVLSPFTDISFLHIL